MKVDFDACKREIEGCRIEIGKIKESVLKKLQKEEISYKVYKMLRFILKFAKCEAIRPANPKNLSLDLRICGLYEKV